MNSKNSACLKSYKYLVYSEKTKTITILLCLVPQIALLFVTKSWNSLFIALSCVTASLAVEIFEKFKKNSPETKKSFGFLTAVLQGILISFLIPSTYPVIPVFLIALFTLFLCAEFMGGFADNFINPVALTVCISWLLGVNIFPEYGISHEILLSKNPSFTLIQEGFFARSEFDSSVTSFLNRRIFSLFGVSIPDGYVSLFWDSHSVIPAFRFNFLTIFTSIILISADIIKPLIPGIFIIVYSALVYFVGPVFYSEPGINGDILLCLLTSGTLFTSLFLLQWAGTTPLSTSGKIIYGITAGILGFFIMGAGTSPAGAVFTVLVMNVISPVIQYLEKIAEHQILKTRLSEKVHQIQEGTNA